MREAMPKLCRVDSEIIRYLALNRFAKQADLFASIIGVVPSYNMPRAVRRLKVHGLIEPLLGDADTHLGYRLTKKGLRFARSVLHVTDDALKSRPAFRSQYDHDRIVNEARRILSTSPVISDFVSEAELRIQLGKTWTVRSESTSHDWKVPDALFKLSTRKGLLRVALEIELSQKAKARYAKIMEAILISRQFEVVFFLCKTERLLSLIRSEVNAARKTSPRVKASQRSNGIYFCTLETLRALKLDAPWTGEENRFTICEIEESLAKS
ncbi:MAG: hypothetical protein NDI61_10510 [Bdellovibrionaceae bacterium]|nr:hypothetical protein [Pseudobdellovibrionaceae bacterium]